MNIMHFVNQMMNNNQVLSNPIVKNAVNMAKQNNINGLQQLAENIAKEKGTTIDALRKQIGL